MKYILCNRESPEKFTEIQSCFRAKPPHAKGSAEVFSPHWARISGLGQGISREYLFLLHFPQKNVRL